MLDRYGMFLITDITWILLHHWTFRVISTEILEKIQIGGNCYKAVGSRTRDVTLSLVLPAFTRREKQSHESNITLQTITHQEKKLSELNQSEQTPTVNERVNERHKTTRGMGSGSEQPPRPAAGQESFRQLVLPNFTDYMSVITGI